MTYAQAYLVTKLCSCPVSSFTIVLQTRQQQDAVAICLPSCASYGPLRKSLQQLDCVMAGTADMIEETSSKGYDRPAASGKSVPNGVESEHRPFLEPVRQRSPRRQRQQSAVATLQVEKATEGGGIPGPTEAVLWAAGWFRSSKNRTSMLVNLSAIMERTDEQLLPAVYLFVAAAFRATPEQLGYLTLSRALVQAIASPLGGFLGKHSLVGHCMYSRPGY